MEINIENAKAAFNTADESVKKVLLALFPELKETKAQKAANRPITERVKTFEDACKELGIDAKTWLEENETDRMDKDVLAYLKLRIICAALNEGWKPEPTEDERRWYPWFYLWTEEELSEKDDDWKANHAFISTEDYSGSYAGFASADSLSAPSDSSTYFGPRLCFKSKKLADYCGRQFISLWADFNLMKK